MHKKKVAVQGGLVPRAVALCYDGRARWAQMAEAGIEGVCDAEVKRIEYDFLWEKKASSPTRRKGYGGQVGPLFPLGRRGRKSPAGTAAIKVPSRWDG